MRVVIDVFTALPILVSHPFRLASFPLFSTPRDGRIDGSHVRPRRLAGWLRPPRSRL